MISWKKALRCYVYVRGKKEMDLLFKKLEEKGVIWADGIPLRAYKPALNMSGGLAFLMGYHNELRYSLRRKQSESFSMNDMDWSDDE